MGRRGGFRGSAVFASLISAALAGCATTPTTETTDARATERTASTSADRDCLVRAMYFESNRSSDEGLLAIGSVVMNRVASGIYPHTVCGVVGQAGQFAAGVLSKPMDARERPRVERVADEVLAGKRHSKIAAAMYFHMAGLRFHYGGMHYVLVAGGNAFYEKTSRHRAHAPARPNGDPGSDSSDKSGSVEAAE